MRYRLFDHAGNVFVFKDRPAFHENFLGDDPNNPVGGIVRYGCRFYEVEKYQENCKGGGSLNVFHELENDWYAHLYVKQIIMNNTNMRIFVSLLGKCFWNRLLRVTGYRRRHTSQDTEWGYPYEDFV